MLLKLVRSWRLNSAEMAHARGNYSKAVRLFSQMIDESTAGDQAVPELWTYYLHRGLSFRGIGRPKEALLDYERAAELSPRSHKPHLNAGIILGQDLARHSEALTKFETAVNLNPKDVESLVCLALTKNELGHPDEAETVFREALAMDPNNWLALYNLGNVCLNTNRLPEAIELFSRAKQANPHDPDISHNLAIARSRSGLR